MASPESLKQLAERGAEYGERIPVRGGAYSRWSPGGGAEIWVHLDRRGEPIGINPHFASDNRMRVTLKSRVPDRRGPMDGAFWLEQCDGERCPFVFSAPDYARCRDLKLPAVVELQLSAFAHHIEAYATDADFAQSLPRKPGLASESLIPSGTFEPGGKPIIPPKSEIIITGHVLEADTITNGATKVAFQWARVRTFGAVLDVVTDPTILHGKLVPGGVVFGMFWVSGRVPDYQPPAKPGLLDRVFGKG